MVAVQNQCVMKILEVKLLGPKTTVTGDTSKINLTDKCFALQLDSMEPWNDVNIQRYLCLYVYKQRVDMFSEVLDGLAGYMYALYIVISSLNGRRAVVSHDSCL
jgi:hypothetical protein